MNYICIFLGQNDIKKLRRENDQLRREIWALREEYDRLEALLKKKEQASEEAEVSDEINNLLLSPSITIIFS